jgi:hypothetical protein
MELTNEEKATFYRDGYVTLRGIVPRDMVDAARHAINHSLGEQGMDKHDLPVLRTTSYCKDIYGSKTITGLVDNSPVLPLVESLLGRGNVATVRVGRIALNFPRAPGSGQIEPSGHIEGLGWGSNGLEKGTYIRDFAVFAVILLSDLPGAFAGNFTVWPGSHESIAQYLLENGHERLSDGTPRVALPRGPVQITGAPGDTVLAHYLLLHCAAPNHAPDIRYAAIFKLRHRACDPMDRSAYTDIWREFPGLQLDQLLS